MRRFLSLMCAAACGAVVAMGLATRSLPLEARPVPEPASEEPSLSQADEPAEPPFRAQPSCSGDREEGWVLLGDRVVLRLRSPLDELSAYERALIAAKRLNDVVAQQGARVRPTVEADEGAAHVIANGVRLVTVDAETARLNESSVVRLAEAWRESVDEALGSVARMSDAQSASDPRPPPPEEDETDSGPSRRPAHTTAPGSESLHSGLLAPPRSGSAAWAAIPWALLFEQAEDDPADPEEHPGLYRARPNHPDGREEGQVVRDGVVLLRIRASLGDLSPYERAIITAKRLNDFVAQYGADGPLRVENDQGAVVVRGGAIKLATADAETARQFGTTSDRLAALWVDAIRRSLGGLAPDPDAAAPRDSNPSEPADAPMVELNGAPVVHLRANRTGERLGKAALAGENSSDCVAVIVAESTYDACARLRAFVPVSSLPEEGQDPIRLDACRITAFVFSSEAAATPASLLTPRAALAPIRHAALQERQSFADILETLGAREAVRQFAPELDEAATALARAAGAPVTSPDTTVAPAIDATTLTAVGGVQIGGPGDAVGRVRIALLHPDTGDHSLTLITPSGAPDPGAPEPLPDLEILAWIDFPGPPAPATTDAA